MLLFPERAHVWGPVTRRRLVRTALVYAAIAGGALALIAATRGPATHAFALGLIAPGGGFLLPGLGGAQLGLAALWFVITLAAALYGYASGKGWAPFAIWALGALGAAGRVDGQNPETLWREAQSIVPLASFAVIGATFGVLLWRGHKGLDLRRAANAYLAAQQPHAAPQPVRADELSAEDVALMRLLLDRAHQPVERYFYLGLFNQQQTAARRALLQMISSALSMAQYVHLPAFQGYLTETQLTLARKQQAREVWGYWELEDWAGKGPASTPDPLARENLMFAGQIATQIAMFQAASGRRDFDTPKSLHFQQRDYLSAEASLPALIEGLRAAYKRAPFGLATDASHWISPQSNAIAAAALRLSDGLYETGVWPELETEFVRRLEGDFISAAGRFVPSRSASLGFGAPIIGGAAAQAFPCFFFSTTIPHVARRQWSMLRNKLTRENLEAEIWPLDVSGYGVSRAANYAAIGAAAVEMGDADSVALMFELLDRLYPRALTGEGARRNDASMWAHAAEFLARSGRAQALRDMGRAPWYGLGPHIAQAPYPQVLLARAKYEGGILNAVLYPGAGAGVFEIGFAGLRANRIYRCEGVGEITTNAKGEASLRMPINARTELKLVPCF